MFLKRNIFCCLETEKLLWKDDKMRKPINVAKDGTLFVSCMRPVGKVLYKAKNAPPKIKFFIYVSAALVAVGGLTSYGYKLIKNKTNKNQRKSGGK